MDKILGYIETIVFANPENGFAVLKLKEPHKKELTCVVGSLPSIQPGETIECEGNWKNHPQFGTQFEVINYNVRSPSDLLGMQKYLESGLIKGIGKIYAKRIIEKFALETLHVIDTTPERLLEVEGIGQKRVEKIKSCWNDQKLIREVMVFLQKFQISPSYAQKIFKRYGNDSIKIVQSNPYRLAKNIFGIGFKTADQIAEKLGFSKEAPLRIEAGIEFVLWELTNEGHTCYKEEPFLEFAEKILDIEKEKIQISLKKLIERDQISTNKIDKEDYVALKSLYITEKNIVEELNRIQTSFSKLRSINLEKAIDWVQKKLNITLADNQIEAIKKSVSEKIHIITGGPGTGKSTITNAILSISEKLTSKILLAAPTGKAAKRMSQITRKKAFTLHALLEFDFQTRGFKKNKEHPLNCDLLIIDEASMIDTSLFCFLLKAIPSHARVIIVGDVDQLPSVGPGQILKDLIHSQKISVTTLKEIFRQAKFSNIIINAHKINHGEFPYLTNKGDFLFYEEDEQEIIIKKMFGLIEKIIKKKKFHPFEDIQILSPMKRGLIGTENLNIHLQNYLNPSSKPFFKAGKKFHLGDKVMQIKNNYNKHVYNGDVGYIKQIDLEEQCMTISFDERDVFYDFSDLDEIVLAYAVSIHKYQGSECPCVIMPLHTSHYKLLFRNLLYTGITRGKKLIVLIGSKKAMAMAIHRNDPLKRLTGLQYFFKQASIKTQQEYLF